VKSRLLKYLFFLAAAVTAVVYYIRTRQPYQIMSGETMNTYYRIKIRTDKENNLLHNAIRDELQRINKEMSVFDSSSEISSINNDDSGEWIDLSPEMSEVLKDARKSLGLRHNTQQQTRAQRRKNQGGPQVNRL